MQNSSETELSAAPVPSLCIVPDGIVGPKTDPVRNWPVLSHLLRQLLLDSEGLVRRHLVESGTGWEGYERRKSVSTL